MDVRIQLPSEDEDYVSVVRPSGQVMFQIPIHVYTAWREEGLIDVDIPPTIRERLPPSIRDTAAPMPSPADVELRYFQGGIIDATLHTPDASIRIAMTLENLHRLAPDRLPQLGPMYEWEASIGGDYSYVGDTWLAGVRLTDRWEGFGPSVWTDFSFRGSDTMREIRAEGEGHNLGTDRRIVGYDFDIEVNQVLDELGETSETTDAEEIALTTVAPDANSLVYFRRDSVTGQMRAEFYVREAGVLARGQYIDLTEAEAEALYEHIFAEEEELVRRTYAEMAYGTERGQIGLDGCVLIFPGAEDTEATLQGIGTYEGIRGFVMGGALEATRGGRAMVQAGGMNPSERRFGIGRIFLSGLGIGGIVPDSAIATTEETDEDEEEEELARTAGDRIQLEGWVMRSQRYNIRAFADFALGQLATGEENQLIGGGFGTILQMVREADAWGLGAVGSFSPRQTHEQTIEEPEEQTEYTDEHTVDRIAGSGYYVGQGVLDAIVASILLEDDANTGRFSGGARFNIVPRDLIIELVGGYETDEETEEDAIEDTTIDAGGSIGVLRIPLTSEGYEIPGERRGAAALRIRWDPEDAVARIDAVEGLVIAYQRDEQIIPVVGGEIETDEDADVAARLEAYWLGPSGFGAHGTLTFPAGSTDVTLVAGGGIPPSAIGREGFGLHGGFRVAHPTGRWRTFLVGSYQQDGEVAGATPREDEDELIETAETEVEEETEEETDVVVADHIGTAMLAGIWDIGEDGTAATRARTSLTLALSWMGQWFEDSEEAAHQIDAQARLSRRSPTATVEGIVGTTTHIIPESWTQLLTIGLEMQRRTSLGRMQNPFLRLEYTHDLAGGGEIERRGDIRFTLTGGAEF